MPMFYFIGRAVCAAVSYDAVGDAITVYDPGYEVDHRSGFVRLYRLGLYPFGEFFHHDQQIFLLVGSSFKGSNHIKPPDRERPGNGYSFEGGGWHMALISKELATDASLD